MKKTSLLVSAAAIIAMSATVAQASVPDAQANRLGGDLMPMGGEKAGNGGTIPNWTGGLSGVPAGLSYAAGQELPNPFSGDAIKHTITSANMGDYDAVLTDGYKALLSTYSSYKMNVYQTRRSAAFPDFVYAANKQNAAKSELAGGGNGISGGIMGTAFPIANNALEMVWNHTLRYRAFKITRQFAAAPVTRGGDYTMLTVQDDVIFQWSDPSFSKAEDLNNISLYYLSKTIAPARAAGSVILVHEAMNSAVEPRKAWQYSPGTRRVRRAPNIAYDNPGTNSDGLSTSDSFDGYNGAPNRYDWTVLGKSEKVVAYNDFDAGLVKYADIIKPLHLNQDVVRYENHRVWSVEAKLKPGMRHIYARRVMHQDEDSWVLLGAEYYDGRGELWRVHEMHGIQTYTVPLFNKGAEVVYDLQAGRYLALALQNEETPVNYSADELNPKRYTPAAIRQMGVR